MTERYAGVLLPITALSSPYGVGSMGNAAKKFIDFLAQAGQKIWQVLPLVPTGYGDSPYSSSCATAGSLYLIDVETLLNQGLLTKEECEKYSCETGARVDYATLFNKRIPLLKLAFGRFNREDEGFRAFVAKGEYADFALFMALKEYHGWRAQKEWALPYRKRDKAALDGFALERADEIAFWQFTQYIFFMQWQVLKEYANEHGVQIMGDMPLYVSDDSVEVWAHPEQFLLDEDGQPTEVAGVPPDYFSEDGQLWGNPLYNWPKMQEDNYAWWTARLKKALSMYDIVRIDHFRGFDRFYAVPAGSVNARVGRWLDGPKEGLFEDKKDWKIVAEDLGVMDDGVHRLMRNTGYPRMKIMEFAFDGNPENEHKLRNHTENCVVYTGTHDNATLMEYLTDMDKKSRSNFYRDLQNECKQIGKKFHVMPWKKHSKATMQLAADAVIELAYSSPAKYVVIPMQDLLGLGKEARMNLPGTLGVWNWSWRIDEAQLTHELAERMRVQAIKWIRK